MSECRTTSLEVLMDDGAFLNVKVLGDHPSKPLLIALHGAPGLSSLAEPEAEFGFLAGIFRVLVFDARGSGRSDLTPPFTHDRWVRDIEYLREWAGAKKFVLAGGSYGGLVALDYATLYADRLDGLILRGAWTNGLQGMMSALGAVLTSNKFKDKVDVARQIRLWSGRLLDDRDFEESILEILPIYAPPEVSVSVSVAESIEEVAKEMRIECLSDADEGSPYHSITQNAAFSGNLPHFDVRHKLADIKAPTLVVVGRHDVIAPVTFSEEIAAGIPRSTLKIFERSGHNPAEDEPQQLEEAVLEFVKDHVNLNVDFGFRDRNWAT